MIEDFERCYLALKSRDRRFDGWFYTAVTTTKIYCRPSCPAVTPKRSNVRFYATAAAAQAAGFRACRRCRPDAAPGSPEWNIRADLLGRAMRLIADGIVDREGVTGLARRLGYSERHLHRLLVAEVGAGPLALARAQRAHTARLLIETTDLAFSDVAFGAGFSSIRQFNDTVRSIFGISPTELRRSRHGSREHLAAGTITLRLPYRSPFHAEGVFRFLSDRAVPGVEEPTGTGFRRTLRLAHGPCSLALSPGRDHVRCAVRLTDLRDLGSAVHRARRLLDLDADPVAVVEHFIGDPLLGPAVEDAPGRRVPGCVDGEELALRAVLGQQISVTAARTAAGRLVASFGEPLKQTDGALTSLFPTSAVIAGADPTRLGLPESRGRALVGLAAELASGAVVIDAGADREEVAARLTAIAGIGPWTAAYVALRALGDPDAFLPGDLGVRRALRVAGRPLDSARVTRLAEPWRPWRAYALQYLWAVPVGAALTQPVPPRSA